MGGPQGSPILRSVAGSNTFKQVYAFAAILDSGAAGLGVGFVLLGLAVGSFLNVVAYRIPIGGSVWTPKRSYCPSCEAQLSARDNIPVLSWLVLRGQCRACDAPISVQYPIVEAATGIAFGSLAAYRGLEWQLVADLVFTAMLVAVTVTDLQHRIIPNKILLPVAVAALPLQLLADPNNWYMYLAAGGAGFVFLLIVALMYPAGMGMGDVKLAGVMGLYLGAAVAPALLGGFLFGSVFGLAVMAKMGVAAGRKTKVPFGPFLAAGSFVALFIGDWLIDWYLESFF